MTFRSAHGTPSRSAEIDAALLQAVTAHPRDLVGMVAAQLGLSGARVSRQVRAPVATGYRVKHGTTRPVYVLGRNRRCGQRHPRAGLAEGTAWFGQLSPLLQELPSKVLDIAH